MEAVTEQIGRIQAKLQELAKKHAAAIKEISQQQKTISTLKEQQFLQEKKIKTLEEQQHILRSAAGNLGEKDRKDFELVINRYMREIDKCIDLLSE